MTQDGSGPETAEAPASEVPVPRGATPVEDDGVLPAPLVDLLEAPVDVESPPPAGGGRQPGKAEVTCPRCGTVGTADLARRDAADFCTTCDFPLFWVPSRVTLPESGNLQEGGLRRLPGTAGFAALAAINCPECTEPNPPSGQTCVRCGADLHPAPVADEPAPVPVAEPEPEPVADVAVPWWRHWWVALAAAALVALVAIVLLVLFA